MVENIHPQDIELVLNEPSSSHSRIVKSLLGSARHFLCMTAFAKKTGMEFIRKELRERLKAGLEAQFIVGLNFYQTDPEVLEELLGLSRRFRLTLMVSNPPWNSQGETDDPDISDGEVWNFHPKVFISKGASGTSALVGSANLTRGGLSDNHESSILVRAGSEVIVERLDRQIKRLIREKQIVPASQAIIAEYARRHAIYSVHKKLAERRASRDSERTAVSNVNMLDAILAEMRADKSDNGFQAQRTYRDKARNEAQSALALISSKPPLSKDVFLKLYEPLVADLWHSGGLQRGKNFVAQTAPEFQEALRSLGTIASRSVEQAFNVLHQEMQKVKGAGTNVMTEILHTHDNLRFAVMNQNSVSGLALAGITGFPKKPDKGTVDGALYAEFCNRAGEVRDQLGLKNFTELDALFNYAYWG